MNHYKYLLASILRLSALLWRYNLASQELLTRLVVNPINKFTTRFFAKPPSMLYLMNILLLLHYLTYSSHMHPPPYLIRPNYIYHGGTGCLTATTDRLGYGWFWVSSLGSHAHPPYNFDCHHLFRFRRHGLRSCVKKLPCRNIFTYLDRLIETSGPVLGVKNLDYTCFKIILWLPYYNKKIFYWSQ